MDCTAYCTASAYKLKSLYDFLRTRYPATLRKDVLYVELQGTEGKADVFLFSYGATVCWNLASVEALAFLELIKPYEEGSLANVEVDESEFSYGEVGKIRNGIIVLPDKEMLTKLSVSEGLSQSVKLASFEVEVQKSYDFTRNIPEELSKHGSIRLSRRAIRQRMGELFNVRSSINLKLEVLDSPDFFWEYPELEPLYLQVAADEELQKRLDVLNKRLSIVHEMFEMLGNELNHQHSSRLEWIIIILIIIEVVLTLLRDVFGWL